MTNNQKYHVFLLISSLAILSSGVRSQATDLQFTPFASVSLSSFEDYSTCVSHELDSTQLRSIKKEETAALRAATSEPQVREAMDSLIPGVWSTRTSTSVGLGLPDLSLVAAIAVIPIPGSDWGRALAISPSLGPYSLSSHYEAQVQSMAQQHPEAATFTKIAILYGAPEGDKQIDCAIALYDLKSRRFVYLSDILSRPAVDSSPIRLEELPRRRSDVTEDTVLVEPGAGFLIPAGEILKSKEYRRYLQTLQPDVRASQIKAIETDTSPWLVDDGHIGWFDVDRDVARRAAAAMWQEQLDQANSRFVRR